MVLIGGKQLKLTDQYGGALRHRRFSGQFLYVLTHIRERFSIPRSRRLGGRVGQPVDRAFHRPLLERETDAVDENLQVREGDSAAGSRPCNLSYIYCRVSPCPTRLTERSHLVLTADPRRVPTRRAFLEEHGERGQRRRGVGSGVRTGGP